MDVSKGQTAIFFLCDWNQQRLYQSPLIRRVISWATDIPVSLPSDSRRRRSRGGGGKKPAKAHPPSPN